MSAYERGVSLLAALVFIGILSGVALGVQYATEDSILAGTRQSQLAQASSATAGSPTSPTKPADQPPAAEQAKAECTANDPTRVDPVTKRIKKVGKYCKPHDEGSGVDIKVKANCEPYDTIPAGKCVVEYCPPDAKKVADCRQLVQGSLPVNIPRSLQEFRALTDPALSRNEVIPYEKSFDEYFKALGSPAGSEGINDAFDLNEYKKYVVACSGANAIGCDSSDIQRLDELQRQYDTELKKYSEACSGGSDAGCDSSDVKKLEELKLTDDLRRYASACSGANAATCDPSDVRKLDELKRDVATPRSCPPGQAGTFPDCKSITTGCTGGICNPGPENRTLPPGDILSKIAPLLGSFLKGLLQPESPRASAQACPSDPNQYAQYQQQYQYQLQQYNYQLQQYNYQQQLNQYYGSGYGGYSALPPAQPTPCRPSTSQQCQSQPAQPPTGNCTAGIWKPNYSGACIVNWQCVPNSQNAPKAELSCEPKVADVGMTLAISYSCSAGTAIGGGFTASTSPSGSATTTVATPPQGTNTATYRLTCNNSGVTTGAQCSVQVAAPAIVLVANPKRVPSGKTSLIGWVTSGMQSCIVSSPDDSSFTSRNSSNTSVSGTATTSPITAATNYLLHCQTIGGGVRDATTTVSLL